MRGYHPHLPLPVGAERGEGKVRGYHPHLPLPVGAERGEGKVRGYHPPSSPRGGEEGGKGEGEGRQTCSAAQTLKPLQRKGVPGGVAQHRV